jgi:hypothetical protein
MLPIKETQRGLIFFIRVLAGSSRCEISGIRDDALKIKITSPPIEGRANEECIRFLADQLGIKKSQVQIIAGYKSKIKTVAVSGLTRENFLSIIKACL